MTTVTYAYTQGRPLLPVVVGLNRAKVFGLANAGRPIPQPVARTFLIDTGAEDTWVTRDTMDLLNLLPFNAVPVQTGALGSGAAQFDQ